MPDEPSAIPLADVLRVANELGSVGLIKDYALGGALAAIYYTEPFTTYDADIVFIAAEKGPTAGIPAIYSYLQKRGWRVEHEHLVVKDFPVQFLAGSGLTEEAVREAKLIEYEGAGESFSSRIHHCHRRERWTIQRPCADRATA